MMLHIFCQNVLVIIQAVCFADSAGYHNEQNVFSFASDHTQHNVALLQILYSMLRSFQNQDHPTMTKLQQVCRILEFVFGLLSLPKLFRMHRLVYYTLDRHMRHMRSIHRPTLETGKKF